MMYTTLKKRLETIDAAPTCEINAIDIEEYNSLKEQMFLWQSKANRWATTHGIKIMW